MAEFNCPKCDHVQTVSDSHVGKRTKCPKCGEQGKIVDTASQTATDAVDLALSEDIVVLR